MARTPKKQPTFLTKRLRLRPFRGSDVQALHELYGDADNLRYWSVEASPNLARTRRMMHWHLVYRPRHYVMWAIEERAVKKSGGRGAIGMINYHRRDLREKRVDVGWLMLPACQGKGYAAEAGRALLKHLIGDLGIHKVEALIAPENKPSAALARRLGFRLEGGPIRDRWLVSGRWHSVMIYGLLAGEER
jgi:[ribosomal protein S5]-alanine N-acetyltransferase